MRVKVTKEAVCITECVVVNEGELQVNTCDFILPQCFDGLVVTAVFNNIPVPLTGTQCYIPSLKKGTAVLGVYAYKENESGELILMYSPKPASFYVNNGSYCEKVKVEDIPSITEFEKYCAAVSALTFPKSNLINEVVLDEDFGENKVYTASALNPAFSEISDNLFEINKKIDEAYESAEKKNNKTKSIDASSTDTQYPTAAAVYNALLVQKQDYTVDKQELQNSINNLYSRITYVDNNLQSEINDVIVAQGNLQNAQSNIIRDVNDLHERTYALQGRDDSLVEEINLNKTGIADIKQITDDISTEVDGVKDNVNALHSIVGSRVTDNANAIKGLKSGVGQVQIDDASPLTHLLDVTVEGDNAQNSVIECKGKNMLDFNDRKAAEFNPANNMFTGNNLFLSVSGNGIYKNNGAYSFDEIKQTLTISCVNAWYGLGLDFKVSGNSKYAVSVKSASKDFTVVVSYYDATGTYISFASGVENSVITTPTNAAWMVIIFTGKVKNTEGEFICPQLEQGNSITEYQPYFATQVASPDAMGNISEFTSKGSGTTIRSDDTSLNITCRYNKDTMKAYNRLVDAIIALGGSV